MALILKYVDIRGVGFDLVCWSVVSRRSVAIAGDGSESKARSLRDKQRSSKILNLTPIPAIGSTSKLNHSHTNKINLTFRFFESFADPSRPSVRPLNRDTRHASVGKESGIGVLAPSPLVACVWTERERFFNY